MPRIRTIKPEFWTDSVVVQLPFEARLLFIGIWNFCDDQGYLVNEPERLRMQVFPGEPSIDLASLLDLLVASSRLEAFVAPDGEPLLRVKNFEKHQRVDNPSKARFAGAKKRTIPQAVRRSVAEKYGCAPGGERDVECFYCGVPGAIRWWRLGNGKPSSWVSFTLELDHVDAEAGGGVAETMNIVLACRTCNRSKGTKEFAEMWPILATTRESYPAEGKGRGREEEGKRSVSALPIDTTRNSKSVAQPAEPWPADLVEQLRAPLQRQLETNDDAWAEFLHTTAAKYPLQRRVNAGLVLLQRAETGETFGLGYLLTLIRDGVEPRKQRQGSYANGNGVPIERMTVPASESKVLPPYVPPPESRDEMNKRLLDRAEAEIAKRKGRAP